MDRDHLLALLDDYLEGELTEERQAELERLLLDHVEARRLYWDYLHQHMLLQKIEQETDGRTLACQEAVVPAAARGPAPASRVRRLSWLATCAAGLLCAVGLAYFWARPGTPVANPDELVLVAARQVVVVRGGAEQPATDGMVLHWGDQLIVAPEGNATLRFQGAVRLEVAEGSIVDLAAPPDGGKTVELRQGSLTFEVDESHSFAVRTATAEVEAQGGRARGLLVAAPTSTRLEVERGAARLRRNTDGQTTEVSAGSYVVAAPGMSLAARPLPKHAASDDLPVLLATWLGGQGASTLNAAAVASDGSIYIGGTLPGADPELGRPERQSGRGDGVVLRLAADGSRVQASMRFEGSVDALSLDGAGQVYAAGAFGCAKLDAALRQTVWSTKGKFARMVPGPEGGAVVLAGNTITTLDRQGKALQSWTVADRMIHDLACDVEQRTVFATGSNLPDAVGRVVPFVYAYDAHGRKLWTAHGWTQEQVVAKGLGAASEGMRLALGHDGQLYVAGQAHGGNTVWGRHGDDLDQKLPQPRGDRFQMAYGIGGQHLTFIGRLDARTGRSDGGTVLLGRHAKDQGASMRPLALAADAEGRIYVGGWAGATPPTSQGAFGLHGQGGGAYLCVFDRDFNRLY
ncbi:MAG: FecR domain-containing protein, partial [Planctomycetia bacterium]|nr:FecR domain-containing protein [Planctomycetia bacterium]